MKVKHSALHLTNVSSDYGSIIFSFYLSSIEIDFCKARWIWALDKDYFEIYYCYYYIVFSNFLEHFKHDGNVKLFRIFLNRIQLPMPQPQLAQLSLRSTSTTLTFLFLLEEIGSPLFSPVLCRCFLLILLLSKYN